MKEARTLYQTKNKKQKETQNSEDKTRQTKRPQQTKNRNQENPKTLKRRRGMKAASNEEQKA
jgi:hypothetical protein